MGGVQEDIHLVQEEGLRMTHFLEQLAQEIKHKEDFRTEKEVEGDHENASYFKAWLDGAKFARDLWIEWEMERNK